MAAVSARLFILQAALLAPLVGCGPGTIPSFHADNPAARNAAIVDAAATGDTSSVPQLVRMLESSEPSTRLLAIETLERLTGETLGYDYAAAPAERRAAVGRWREYVSEVSGR